VSVDGVPDAVRRYFAAVNVDRFDALADLFADTIVIEMGSAPPRHGIADALAYYPKALADIPVHEDDPVSVMSSADGRRVAVEIAFSGTTGDGRPVKFTAVDLFDLDDTGRIVRLRSIYDTNTVREQLRAPSQGAER
jgi:ketosteroid isomerase-like protein